MADKVKIGDIVRLKSGGPKMTVCSMPRKLLLLLFTFNLLAGCAASEPSKEVSPPASTKSGGRGG